MKTLLLFLLLLPLALPAQKRIEKSNTIYGVALLVDTARVWKFISDQSDHPTTLLNIGKDTMITSLTTTVLPAFSITRYTVEADDSKPRVVSVKYFGLDDCAEIPFNRIIHFKQQ